MERVSDKHRSYCVIQRNSEVDPRKIDKDGGVKNKWLWDWLTVRDVNNDFMADYYRKIDVAGKVFCIWCAEVYDYSGGGKRDLLRHAVRSKHHLSNKKQYLQNTVLPPSWTDSQAADSVNDDVICEPRDTCNAPYGAAENICDSTICAATKTQQSPPVSHVCRRWHMEAFVVSFVAENSLSFSFAPKLVKFAQECSRDPEALNSMQLCRESVSYKLTDGVSVYTKKELVKKMKVCPFSLNIDECVSSNHRKVLSILVSYFDETIGRTVVRHYESVDMIVVKAITLKDKIVELFQRDGIPLSNIVSDLSDSTNYMRGKKGGFETLLRNVAPQMLDIDGDLCHHVHNAIKNICKPFDKYIEQYLDDTFNDNLYSTDILDCLQEVCLILDTACVKPPERVPHRWLSLFDVLLVDSDMFDAFRLIYFSWMSAEDKRLYRSDMKAILKDHEVSKVGRSRVYELQGQLGAKKLTDAGKERKARLWRKLYYETDKLKIYSNMFLSILPLFKSLVFVLEQKEPQIHRLHDLMGENIRNFFACFLKFELLNKVTMNNLVTIDLNELKREKKYLYIGKKNEKLFKELKFTPGGKETVREFLKKLEEAYLETGKYLQKKYALNNKLLQRLSAIDPCAREHTLTYVYLKELFEYFEPFIHEKEDDDYELELQRYMVDKTLPEFRVGEERLDEWWNKVFATGRYPILTQLVKAALSIFTGPMVEGSFSMMGDVISKKKGRLAIATYSSYMDVKYDLNSRGTDAITEFHREDILRSPVNNNRCYYVRTAAARMKKKRNQKKEARRKKRDAFLSSSQKQKVKAVTLKKKTRVHMMAKDARQAIYMKAKKRALRDSKKAKKTQNASTYEAPKSKIANIVSAAPPKKQKKIDSPNSSKKAKKRDESSCSITNVVSAAPPKKQKKIDSPNSSKKAKKRDESSCNVTNVVSIAPPKKQKKIDSLFKTKQV